MCGVEPENSISDEITKSRWLDLAEPQGKAASQGVNRSGQRDFFVFLSGNGVLRAFDSLGLKSWGVGLREPLDRHVKSDRQSRLRGRDVDV